LKRNFLLLPEADMTENMVCQNIRVSGVVQGVGFRPFVWRLARELGLAGWVRNDSRGVEIEVAVRLSRSGISSTRLERKRRHWPASVRWSPAIRRRQRTDQRDFVIIDSRSGRAATMIGHDTAVCRDCLAEMFEPGNRRWRYAFTNCTNCGPRYTISRGLPYDRVRTSLKPFVMCPKCQHEYRKPEDRRFHAEANCCPKCGPQLAPARCRGQPAAGDPLAATLALLRRGRLSPSRVWGAFIWLAMPAMRSPSRSCASASSVTRSPSWSCSPTPLRRLRSCRWESASRAC
jgi:hydrogenase maturation protein HypF